jgi:hypothetical protein
MSVAPGRHAIEAQHALHRAIQDRALAPVVLGRGRDHPGTERLGQEHALARAETPLDQDAPRIHTAGHAEAVLGLRVHHGMAARDDAARLADLVGAAAEDGRDDVLGQLAREAGHVEREQHLPAHRVHVGHGIRGRDRSEEVWVVHDRRKEVDRLHDGHVVGHAVDRRVIAAAEPDQQVGMLLVAQVPEHVLEISRTHLGRSPRAGGVGGEADLLAGLRIDQLRVHDGGAGTARGGQTASASTKARKASASGERLRSRWVAR